MAGVMNPIPFRDGDALTGQRVGAIDPDRNYRGPVADVEFNKDWLYITTDEYEGHAMLNIEALPQLIEALEAIRAALPTVEYDHNGKPKSVTDA